MALRAEDPVARRRRTRTAQPYSPVPSTMSSSAGHGDEGVHVVEGRVCGPRSAMSGDGRRHVTTFHPMCGSFSPRASRRTTSPGSSPRPVAPPCSAERSKSSCMPRHSPITGTPAAARSRTSSSRPAARRRRIASGNAPTPGTTRPSAAAQDVVVAGQPAVRRRRARRPSRPSGGCPCRSRRSRSRRSASPSSTARRSRSGSIVDRRAQRASERLERRLDEVVGVRAGLEREVQRQPRGAGDGAHELLGELVLEPAGHAGRDRDALPDEQRAARRCRARTTRAPRPSGRRRGRSG